MMEKTTRGTANLLRIGEIADRANVRTDTLRYYEKLGLLEPAARSPGGYRLYALEALDRLSFIKKAQSMGLSLEEVGDVITEALEGAPPCDHVRSTIRRRLEELDERIADLRALRETLARTLERSSDLPVSDGCLCGIIEAQELPAGPPPAPGARPKIMTRKGGVG